VGHVIGNIVSPERRAKIALHSYKHSDLNTMNFYFFSFDDLISMYYPTTVTTRRRSIGNLIMKHMNRKEEQKKE
jgi:hypothetical protein